MSTASTAGLTGISSPSAPHAPAGLVVSKAGLEATAKGNTVVGSLCLKITLPKDGDGHPQRWELFHGPKPKLRSIPALYPLPASLALASTSKHISTAAALLSLPPPGAYPPAPADNTALKPYVDVSRSTDQVYVVVDSSPPSNTAQAKRRRSSIGARARSEWLIVIEFESAIEEDNSNGETWYKASIPTPKCLDNFIRLEIVPRDAASPTAEIITMPRVLPLPSSIFDAHGPATRSKRSFEDGWEDGEVHGSSEGEESDEDDSSWLHGRYQSTDVLSLQWGFTPALGTPPDLRIAPHWDAVQPSIGVTFEAVIAAIPGPFGLEAILPPGWGWRDLQIRADGLSSWRSADQHGLGALVSTAATNPNPDDTQSTVDAFSPTLGGQNAMPNLAPLDHTDFSFELNSYQEERPMPTTPSLRRIERHGAAVLKVVPRTPTPASEFELEFESGDSDDEGDDDRVLLIEGTLVPLPQTLVSPGASIPIPFFRFDDASLPTECEVQCPESALVRAPSEDEAEPLLCDTTGSTVGTFAWTDASGARLPARQSHPVTGTVRVIAQRNIWGLQTVSIMLPWPAKSEELVLGLSVPAEAVRVVRASARGSVLPHAVHSREEDGRCLAEVRVGKGRGNVELVLEVADDAGVALPNIPGSGELRVELAGDGWGRVLASLATNLERRERVFTGELGVVPYITLAPTPPPAPKPELEEEAEVVIIERNEMVVEDGKGKMLEEGVAVAVEKVATPEPPAPAPAPTLPPAAEIVKSSRTRALLSTVLSWNTLINLVLLWILASLATQVARLRAEVAFVADETRDLRLYGLDQDRNRDRYDRHRSGRGDANSNSNPNPEQAAGPDSAVTSTPPRKSAADTAAEAADADAIDDALDKEKGKANDERGRVPAKREHYGVSRNVRHAWDWRNTLRVLLEPFGWFWQSVKGLFASMSILNEGELAV